MRLGLGSQSVQIDSGRSWRLLDALGVFWRVLEASGGPWRLLDGLLEAPGGSWRLLAPRASRSSNLDSQGIQIQQSGLVQQSGLRKLQSETVANRLCFRNLYSSVTVRTSIAQESSSFHKLLTVFHSKFGMGPIPFGIGNGEWNGKASDILLALCACARTCIY